MKITRLIAVLLLLLICKPMSAQEVVESELQQLWGQEYTSASQVVTTYKKVCSLEKLSADEKVKNDFYIWLVSGDLIYANKGEVDGLKELFGVLPTIMLTESTLKPCKSKNELTRFVDGYFMIRAMQKGATFDEARDGIAFTTKFPGRSPNQYDKEKLQAVFSSNIPSLQAIYLDELKFVFSNYGLPDNIRELRPVIEKNIPQSSLKEEVLALYDQYEKLRKGMPAPDASFKDESGCIQSISDYKGKVIVVDIWATWCSSCLKKMPYFISLKESFAERSDIVFLAVSIDRKNKDEVRMKAINQHNMEGLINLSVDSDHTSPFEEAYAISGIPRYIVIDKDGKVVDVFAPSPDKIALKELINQVLL